MVSTTDAEVLYRRGAERQVIDRPALRRRSGQHVTVIATAEALDAEMADRIARHRLDRPDSWTLIESPDLVFDRSITGTVIVDCLSMWASNRLLAGDDPVTVEAVAEDLASWAASRDFLTIAVSNEVGSGIVPDYELGRVYRDMLGGVPTRSSQPLRVTRTSAWPGVPSLWTERHGDRARSCRVVPDPHPGAR